MFDAGGSAHFLCSLLLRWSLQNLILILRSPYLAVVQVPGNHVNTGVCVVQVHWWSWVSLPSSPPHWSCSCWQVLRSLRLETRPRTERSSMVPRNVRITVRLLPWYCPYGWVGVKNSYLTTTRLLWKKYVLFLNSGLGPMFRMKKSILVFGYIIEQSYMSLLIFLRINNIYLYVVMCQKWCWTGCSVYCQVLEKYF